MRFSGCALAHSAKCSWATIGVWTPVGCSVLTLMENSAKALAYDRISPTTPCLAAA